MPHYFYLLNDTAFRERIRPALSASRQARSFAPCRAVCRELLPAAAAFRERYHLAKDDLLLPRIADGLAFDRHVWRVLVGEILLVAADDVPKIEVAPETLCCLLAPRHFREGVR